MHMIIFSFLYFVFILLLEGIFVQMQALQQMVVGPAAAAAAKSLQYCLILRDPTDGSPPGSPVPGILQARTREWIRIFPYIHTYDSFIYKLGTVRD